MPIGSPSTTRHTASSTTRTVVAVTGVVVGVLALAAWGVTSALRGPTPSDAGAAPATHTAPARPVPAATPLPATTAQDGPVVAFGNPYVVDNVDVVVSTPTRFTPTEVAATSDGSDIQRAVRCTVTLTNDTSRPLNAQGISVEGLVNGTQVGQVYDRDIPNLTADIGAGATTTFPIAFNVPSAASRLVIQIAPESMTSTGSVYYAGTV
jgi:hypothetical protein